ncbi:MAG TPA: DUF3300 domain-containing protein [Chthoniobacterales bacterium]|jgi:hypothetical protein
MQTPIRPASLLTVTRWGARCALATVIGFSPLIHAQNAPAPAVENSTNSDGTELLSDDALDELLGPIALYPDALIALILPASTVPSDITLASRYLANGGDGDQVDDQSWDPSVKSLAHYPDVVKWMDDNLEWTTSVGEAFVAQPADVMNSIQRLRGEANAAGNLQDTPQQKVVKQVVEEKTYIRIVPAEPEVIYVPQYDPEVVYVEREPDYIGPVIGFGVGFAVGSWLNYDCDWGRRDVYYGDYRRDWYRDGGWDRGNNNNNNWVNNTVNNVNNVNVVNIDNSTARPWRASANSRRQLEQRRPAYNRRVQQANAEVRAARNANGGKKGSIARHNAVKSIPQPTRLSQNSNRGKNGNGKGQNGNGKNNNGGKGKNGDKAGTAAALKPNNFAPNANGNQNGKGNGKNKGDGNGNGKNKGDGPKHHGVNTPSAAPNVPGQLNRPKNADNKPGKGNGKGNGNGNSNDEPRNSGKGNGGGGNGGGNKKNNDGPSKRQNASGSSSSSTKRASSPAPGVDRPSPKKASNDRPKSQDRPKASVSQPRPRSNDSRPKQQAQPKKQSQPKSQASKPSSGPKNNGGGNGGGGRNNGGDRKNGNNDNKKKGDKKNKD